MQAKMLSRSPDFHSEAFIQNQLDVAFRNAKKNRLLTCEDQAITEKNHSVHSLQEPTKEPIHGLKSEKQKSIQKIGKKNSVTFSNSMHVSQGKNESTKPVRSASQIISCDSKSIKNPELLKKKGYEDVRNFDLIIEDVQEKSNILSFETIESIFDEWTAAIKGVLSADTPSMDRDVCLQDQCHDELRRVLL